MGAGANLAGTECGESLRHVWRQTLRSHRRISSNERLAAVAWLADAGHCGWLSSLRPLACGRIRLAWHGRGSSWHGDGSRLAILADGQTTPAGLAFGFSVRNSELRIGRLDALAFGPCDWLGGSVVLRPDVVALANQGQRMNWSLWLELHLHFCMLSLLAVGGALAIVPEMHRYLVNDLQLLSETAFSQSVTLAQIAPGPNILLVGVMGWNIGLQAAGGFEAGGVAMATALLMALSLLTAAVLPSSLLSYFMVKWLHLHQHALSVRAFKAGMVPLVMGLMISAGWLLQTASNPQMDWRLLLVCVASMLIVLFTRVHLLWLMLGGALAGAALGM